MARSAQEQRITGKFADALGAAGFLSNAAARDAAFHLTDWLSELDGFNTLLASRMWDPVKAQECLVGFVAHASPHLAAAHRIMLGLPVTDVFGVGAVKGDGRARRSAGAGRSGGGSSGAQTFLDRLRTSKAAKVHRGAGADEIAHMKRILRVRVPAEYEAFLLQLGWARIGPNIVNGLGPDATRAENVFENTTVESTQAVPPMRSSLLAVMNDGMGNTFAIDTRQVKGGKAPIVFWDHEHPRGELQKPKKVASSFEAWIMKLLREEEKSVR